jgi:hypothetical protein
MKRDNVKFAVVAAVCITLSGFPAAHAAVVGFAKNADKVDGKHAVSSTASATLRKGKLVATSRKTGRLPNNIIAKAPNAQRLGGRSAAEYLLASAEAANSNELDGLDSTDFLSLTGTATNSDKLGGLDPSSFLAADGTAANALKLGGLDPSSFLSTTGTAANASKLGGLDPSSFLGSGALTTAFHTVNQGSTWTLFTSGSTAPTFTFACNLIGSTITAAFPTSTTGQSPIFWQGPLSALSSILSGVQSITYLLPNITDASGNTKFSWHDSTGVYVVTASYTYTAATTSCSVLTQTVHTS